MNSWTYYTFKDGRLYDEDGDLSFAGFEWPSASAAEQWLVENDVRGTVR